MKAVNKETSKVCGATKDGHVCGKDPGHVSRGDRWHSEWQRSGSFDWLAPVERREDAERGKRTTSRE